MKPLINLATAEDEEKQKFKRTTVDLGQSLLGVGVTGAAALYTFKQQNSQSDVLNKLLNVKKSLKEFSNENDSIKTISKEIKELVLAKQKQNLEIKGENDIKVLSFLNNTDLTNDQKYGELLRLNGKERVAHLSTMMSMINDPNLSIDEHLKSNLSNSLKTSIQKEGKDLTETESKAIKNIIQGLSSVESTEVTNKYSSLYNYNMNLEKNDLIYKAQNPATDLRNTYTEIAKASKVDGVGKANKHILGIFNKVDKDIFDLIDATSSSDTIKKKTKEDIQKRYDRIKKIFNSVPGFDIELVGVQEAEDQGASFYAKITRNFGGSSVEPIVMPLSLSSEGQFGRKSKYARMNATMSSTSLAPSYVLDLNSVKTVVEDQTLSQAQKKVAIQKLMESNQYEDAIINLMEDLYDKDSLKKLDQHGRNELMEVFRGMTSDINQAMSIEDTKDWYTSTKQKSASQINSNKVLFTFDPNKVSSKDIETLIPKLAELQLGFQGLSGSGAGIKRYEVNEKQVGVRMAYAAMDAEGNPTVTPYNILRTLGVSNEMTTPGAARPGQLFDKPEAFLGFAPANQTNVEAHVNEKMGKLGDINVVGKKGSELLNLGGAALGQELDIVGSNTGFIIHFNEQAKKGQALGLADAMSYAGGETIVAKSIKKNINYRPDMKELSIYGSDEFQRLLAGQVVELEGEGLTNFFNKYADDQGRLIIGESSIGPDFIHRTSAMRKLKLKIAENVDKGTEKQLKLIGEVISAEQGSKIFSEAIKGTEYGVQNILDETGFESVITRANNDAAGFVKLAQEKFGLKGTSNLVLTGQDVITKAPSYLTSFMFGGLRGLGFEESQLMKDVFDPSKYTNDIVNPEDTVAVKKYQTSYLQQTTKNILDFLITQKETINVDPGHKLTGQVTEETIGAILTSSEVLDVYKNEKGDQGYLSQLLDDSAMKARIQAAGLDVEQIKKRARTGFGFGYVSTYAGTPSSEYKSKLARIEPRVATYMMGALKSLFGMEDKEIGQFLGNMISNVEGSAEKISLMPTLLMTSKSFNPLETADKQALEIDQMLKSGKLFNASKEFAVAFMGANLESTPEALVKFFQSDVYKTHIIGEQEAFGAVFNIEDLFRNSDDTIDEEGLRLLRNKIGGKDQIVLPMQKALEIVSGVELKREGEDFKIQGEFYRKLNDAFSAFNNAKLAKNSNAKASLIEAGLSSISGIQETTGKIMRNLFSGRVKGSSTLEGKGIRLGNESERTTVLSTDAAQNTKIIQNLNKALVTSQGYGVFMDTQAFMNTISSLTDEEKLYQTKKFMLGMEGVDFDLDNTGKLITKEAAPEGIRASVFRNPFLGPTHMAIMSNVFRYDTDFLEQHKQLADVVNIDGEHFGFRKLKELITDSAFVKAATDQGNSDLLETIKKAQEVQTKGSGTLDFKSISILYKALEKNPGMFKAIRSDKANLYKSEITKIQNEILEKKTKLNNLEDNKINKPVKFYNELELSLAKKEFYKDSLNNRIKALDSNIDKIKQEISNLNPHKKKIYDKAKKETVEVERYKFINDFIKNMESTSNKDEFIKNKLINKRLRSEFNLFLRSKDLMLDKNKDLKLNTNFLTSASTQTEKEAFYKVFNEFKDDYKKNPNIYNDAYKQIQSEIYNSKTKEIEIKAENKSNSVYKKRILQKQASYFKKTLLNIQEKLKTHQEFSKELGLSTPTEQLTDIQKQKRIEYIRKQNATNYKLSDLTEIKNVSLDFNAIKEHLLKKHKDKTASIGLLFGDGSSDSSNMGKIINLIYKNSEEKGKYTRDEEISKLKNYNLQLDISEEFKRNILTQNDKISEITKTISINDLYKDIYKNQTKNPYTNLNLDIGESYDLFDKSKLRILRNLKTESEENDLLKSFKSILTNQEIKEFEDIKIDEDRLKFMSEKINLSLEGAPKNQQFTLLDNIAPSIESSQKYLKGNKASYERELLTLKSLMPNNEELKNINDINSDTILNKVKGVIINARSQSNKKETNLFLMALREQDGKYSNLINFGLKLKEQFKIFDYREQNLIPKVNQKQIDFAKTRETKLLKKQSDLIKKFDPASLDVHKIIVDNKINLDQEIPSGRLKDLSNEVNTSYFLKGISEDLYNSTDYKKPTPGNDAFSDISKLFLNINKNFLKLISNESKDVDAGLILKNQEIIDEKLKDSHQGKEIIKKVEQNKDLIKKGMLTPEERKTFNELKKDIKDNLVSYKKEIIKNDIEELRRIRILGNIDDKEIALNVQKLFEYKDILEKNSNRSKLENKKLSAVSSFLDKLLKSENIKEDSKDVSKVINHIKKSEKKQLSRNLKDLKKYKDNKALIDSFLTSKMFSENSLEILLSEKASEQMIEARKTIIDENRRNESYNKYKIANDLIENLETKQKEFISETDSTKKQSLETEINSLKTKISDELYEINNNQLNDSEKLDLKNSIDLEFKTKTDNYIKSKTFNIPKRDLNTGEVIKDASGNIEYEQKTGFSSLDEIKKFKQGLINKDLERETKQKQKKIDAISSKKQTIEDKRQKLETKINEINSKINSLREQIGLNNEKTYFFTPKDQPVETETVNKLIYGLDTNKNINTVLEEKTVGYKYGTSTKEEVDLINYKYLKGKRGKEHISKLTTSERQAYVGLLKKYKSKNLDLSKVENLEDLHKNKVEIMGGEAFDFEKHQLKEGDQLFNESNKIKKEIPQIKNLQADINNSPVNEEGTLNYKKNKLEERIKKLESMKKNKESKLATSLANSDTLDVQLKKALDETLGGYINNYSRAVGSGSGQIVFPEFESEFTFKDLKGNEIKDYSIKVRTDLSRAMVGDFDADIYQAIIHDKNVVDQFKHRFSDEGIGKFQKQAATFTLNMEMIKQGMDQFGKRLNEQTGQILDYKTFRGSEVTKEQILKGTVGGVDTTAKSAVIGAMYSMMNSKDDLSKLRKTHLAAQTLVSAAQEIVVIKSKSLEQATDVGKRYQESIEEAFKTGNTQKFRDFLTKDLFAGTKFEQGFEVSDVTTKDMPDELSAIHKKNLMSEPIRFDINQVMEGFEEIVSTTRKIGLNKLASDKMYANVMASDKTMNSDVFNNLVNRMWMLESAVTSEQLDDEQFSRLFNQISGLEGSNQVEKTLGSRAVKEAFSSLSNTRLATAATAALGASYLLSSDYSKDTLDLEENFSDSRVGQKIAQKSIYEGYNRDVNMQSNVMERPFYKDMVSRVQSPGETYIAKQQSFLMKGEVNSLGDAQYLNNMVLSNGGTSSMMVNDNRMPLTGSYIDKIMGE